MSDRDDRDREDQGILDSVRRILAHDAAREAGQKGERADDVFELDHAMVIGEPPPSSPGAIDRSVSVAGDPPPSASPPRLEPTPPTSTTERSDPPRTAPTTSAPADAATLLGDHANRAAGASLASLRQAVRERASVATHRAGPTIEDVIREELRPLLRDWLDQHLPATVEKLVRAEIERIAARDL